VKENVMLRSLFVCLVLLLSGVAIAQDDFSYTWLQISWADVDSDNFGTGDGLGVSASFELTPNFHVFGGYTGIDADSDIDASGWDAGIGLNTPLSQNMDVVVRLGYQTTEIDLPQGGTVDNDGLGFGAGIRVGANEWIEVYGGLTYLDLDSGNETVFDAGFLLNIGDAFAAGVAGSWDDEVSTWTLNGRLYFD